MLPFWRGAALLLPAGASASAFFVSGSDLYTKCTHRDATLDYVDCLGYIAAIADALTNGSGVGGLKACLPPKVTREAILKQVVEWIAAHPEVRQSAAAGAVANALAEGFACTSN
ncbi:MAG: Rap1a/Tai family immunity protein [Bauldia sp.]